MVSLRYPTRGTLAATMGVHCCEAIFPQYESESRGENRYIVEGIESLWKPTRASRHSAAEAAVLCRDKFQRGDAENA
jgi:hypothetical protein